VKSESLLLAVVGIAIVALFPTILKAIAFGLFMGPVYYIAGKVAAAMSAKEKQVVTGAKRVYVQQTGTTTEYSGRVKA